VKNRGVRIEGELEGPKTTKAKGTNGGGLGCGQRPVAPEECDQQEIGVTCGAMRRVGQTEWGAKRKFGAQAPPSGGRGADTGFPHIRQ